MKMDELIIIHCCSGYKALYTSYNKPGYLIIQIVCGGGIVKTECFTYLLNANDFVMLPPNVNPMWEFNPGTIINYCIIDAAFVYSKPHIADVFRNHRCSKGGFVITMFKSRQAAAIALSFEMIKNEVCGVYDDKEQAILIHLQIILLLGKRGGVAALPYRELYIAGYPHNFHNIYWPFINTREIWRNN